MKKKLFAWIVATSVSLVFFATVTLFIYWTITDASWWIRDLSASLVFVEGMAVALWSTASARTIDRHDAAIIAENEVTL
ncbi:MAG TPA: hypothetical protein VFA10_30230 [Ktedonobacteraceae bacterium]|nr:hypothetical protein [Ktedonobacteraceae bacterium]